MSDRKPIIRRNPDNTVDEIIVHDLDFFHIEQMDNGHWWIMARKGGQRMHINLHSRRKIRLSLIEEGEE